MIRGVAFGRLVGAAGILLPILQELTVPAA